MTWLILILIIVILIGLNALYVAAEFATISARRSRIQQMAEEEENRAAQLLLPFVQDVKLLDTYVATCQVGITISSLVLGFYGQASLTQLLIPLLDNLGLFSEAAAASTATVLVLISLTMLQVVMGELVPKNIGVQYPEKLALLTVLPMRWSMALLRPLIWLFNGSGRLILRLMRVDENAGEFAHIHAPDEILMLVEESGAGGLIQKEERRLLENTLRLRALAVRQVMIPRTQMLAAPASESCDALLRMLAKSPYSRLPLYEESVDNIVGVVHLKDLLCRVQNGSGGTGRQAMRAVRFVFESAPAGEVFVALQQQQYNLGIVLDEYGGTAGMVTLEDLVEEIFGELQDEFDVEMPPIQVQSDSRIIFRGDTLINDLNEWLDLFLETTEVDTIGGLVLSQMDHIPKPGEEVEVGAITLRVERMNGKAVQAASLVVTPEQARILREERL
jgi:CBS domain containing-hemolysin-like protein